MIYRLDPSKPYLACLADDNKWYEFTSLDDFKQAIYEHGITESSLKLMCGADLITWLTVQKDKDVAQRGVMLEQLVKQLGADEAKRKGWYLLYSIIPELGLNFQTDNRAADYVSKSWQIGWLFNWSLMGETIAGKCYKGNFDGKALIKEFQQNFEYSRLKQYLDARKMSNYAQGLRQIFDINANINAHKSAPYNDTMATYKAIEYLGAKPHYAYKGRHAETLDDVENMPAADRRDGVSRGLPEFCALFFHEKKGEAFQFSRLDSYYTFLKAYIPEAYNISSAANEESTLNAAIYNRNKAWSSLSKWRKYSMIFCLIPMVAIITWIIFVSFQSDGAATLKTAFEGLGKILGIILAIIGVVAGLAGGWVGAVIGGLAGYFIPIWLFGFLGGMAPFALSALLISAAIFLIIKLNKFSNDRYIPDNNAYNNAYNQARMYVVCQGLGTYDRTFGSSNVSPEEIFDKSASIADNQRKNVKSTAIKMILLTAATIGIGVLLVRNFNEVKHEATEVSAIIPEYVSGEYSGTFHGRSATMTLVRTEENAYQGIVTIQYTSPMTIKVSGEYSPLTGQLTMHAVKSGGTEDPSKIFDGSITLRDGKTVYEGSYTNTTKGNKHKFNFTL